MPKEDYARSLQRLFELLRLIPKHPVQRTISELQSELSEVLGEPVDKRWMERGVWWKILMRLQKAGVIAGPAS